MNFAEYFPYIHDTFQLNQQELMKVLRVTENELIYWHKRNMSIPENHRERLAMLNAVANEWKLRKFNAVNSKLHEVVYGNPSIFNLLRADNIDIGLIIHIAELLNVEHLPLAADCECYKCARLPRFVINRRF